MGDLRLTRTIPERTLTERFKWIKAFQPFGQIRETRERIGLSTPTDCFWCKDKFQEDETTYLAGREQGLKKLLCASCAKEAGAEVEEPTSKER